MLSSKDLVSYLFICFINFALMYSSKDAIFSSFNPLNHNYTSTHLTYIFLYKLILAVLVVKIFLLEQDLRLLSKEFHNLTPLTDKHIDFKFVLTKEFLNLFHILYDTHSYQEKNILVCC